MYVSRIIFQIKNDQRETFATTAKHVAEAALAMPGCQAFLVLTSPYDSSQYVLYEEWDSAEHADSFKQSNVRNDSVAKLAPAMTAAPDVVEFEAEKKN